MRLATLRRRRKHPLLPHGEKMPEGQMRGGEAIVFFARSPSSGATRHLLPREEKRSGYRLPSTRRAVLALPMSDSFQTTAFARQCGVRPCGAGGEHPLLPHGEKMPEGQMRGAKPLYSPQSPPHPALRVPFSPSGEEVPMPSALHQARWPARAKEPGIAPGPTLAVKKQRPEIAPRPPAPYPPGPRAFRRFSGPAYSRPRVWHARQCPHRPRRPPRGP